MPADEVKVTYRAVAHFLALKKAAAAAKKDLQSLQKQEAVTNKASVEGSKRTAAGHRDAAKAVRQRATATRSATTALLAHNAALKENNGLLRTNGNVAQASAAKLKTAAAVNRDAANEARKFNTEAGETAKVTQAAAKGSERLSATVQQSASRWQQFSRRIREAKDRMSGFNAEQRASIPLSRRVRGGFDNVSKSMKKIGDFRPHLIPPFIALVPIIAGLLAVLNPLVNVLSAVGAVGFAAGSSLISLGGAAISIVPMIAAAVGAISGLLVAFRGIGGVFSKYKAAKQATGGGGGGGAKAESYEKRLREATEDLTDAQQDAIFAQEDLNDARAEAVKRLAELRKAVARASSNENDAAANLQLATENYYNVLADPGSTLGDKMKALADLEDAQQDLVDTRDDAIKNAADLAEAEKNGVEGDRQVILAKRRLREAIEAEADAYEKLKEVQAGTDQAGGGGGASQMDAFNEALAKLSPSAQKVVLALIAMQDAWAAIQRTVQEAFFSKIVDDMDDLAGFLPTVGRLLEKAAGSLGRFAHNFLMLVTSPEWGKDLDIIGDQNVRLLDLFGDGLLLIFDALKDIAIAAGPFTEKLLGGFRDGAANFQSMVAAARESGSLASWLDTIYGRLQQWWAIVKNVAKTLFNYGEASGEFGKWITDGLERLTEGWLKNSEDATKEGSPFKKWLEDIKPLLDSVKGLVGDFFDYLHFVATDPETIDATKDIVDKLRILGDVVGNVLNTLTTSGIGSQFIDTLTSIVDSIGEILDAGGAAGFQTFFDVISDFFRNVADILNDPALGPGTKVLLQLFGGLAALSFIGKFTGLTSLFGWILKVAESPKVAALLAGMGGLKSIAAVAGAGVEVARQGSEVGNSIQDNVGALTSGDPAKAATGANQIQSTLVKETGNGAAISLGANIIDSLFGTDLKGAWDGLVDGFFMGVVPAVQKWFAVDLPAFVAGLGQNVWNGLVSVGVWLGEQWVNFQVWLKDLPYNLGVLAGNIWNNIKGVGPWLGERLTEFQTWARGLPGKIGTWLTSIWNSIPGILAWLGQRLTEVQTWTSTLPSKIGTWLQGIWNSLPGIGNWLANVGSSIWNWAVNLPQMIANAIGGNIFRFVSGFISTQAGGGEVGGGAHHGSAGTARIASGGGAIYRSDGGDVPSGINRPGRSRTFEPVGTDTQPAMLTPGEFVVREPIARQAGIENLEDFNAGIISFAALAQRTSKNKSGSRSSMGFFDGGGLVPSVRPSVLGTQSISQAKAPTYIDQSMRFGDIIVHNPAREPASDSLPRAIRKATYFSSGRRQRQPRLELVANE